MQIHLIAFDIPFPADYGGAIDVFYKIKKLYEMGFKINLHCFQYKDRKQSDFLLQFCEKIYYYPRPLGLKYFLKSTPYIISTRNNKLLLGNLLRDNSPIFFEGLHCTFFYNHPALKNRKKVIRMHNIEWKYYAHLASFEKNFIKKIYYKFESWKLKIYEKQLLKKLDINTQILCISPNDYEYFNKLGVKKLEFLAPFHPFIDFEIKKEKSSYILFHGNLSISDNEKSILFLIDNIFSNSRYYLRIAGKNPSEKLKKATEKHKNIELIENPSEKTMNELIQNAQINLLWSMQAEGIKLKLFYALFLGKFIIANKNIIENTGLESLVYQADDTTQVQKLLTDLFSKEFDDELINFRKMNLDQYLEKQSKTLYTALVPNSI